MQDEGATKHRGKAVDASRKGGDKVRLLTLEDLDGRTKAAQYVHDKRLEVLSDLGGQDQLSTLELIAVDHVVLTAAILRDAGVRWLKGEDVDASTINSLQNGFNRTAAVLGWQRRAKDVTPDLRAYAATKARAGE